jgi:dienelactone hydrolase
MPMNPFAVQQRSQRFADQRWLLDQVIRLGGPEWDQGRLHYLSAPVLADNRDAILGLARSIRKFDDFAREMTKLARHFELRGRAQAAAGRGLSAGDDLFTAAILYGGAQWPLYENSELNLILEQKKTECYLGYAQHADHPVEPVEVPYGGTSLPGYLHLPPGHPDGPLPCVIMISGMDGFKEFLLSAAADRYLARGLAVLALDGPGQGTALTREIWYDPDRYGEAGNASYEFAAARPELDPARIMVFGLSQGSFWATQMAAAEPRFAASSVMFTCFDPANTAMFTMQSPTFAARFMYMTGTTSDTELQAVAERMTVAGLGERMTMPSLVIAGEDDPLTDPAETFRHVDSIAGPKELLFYTAEDHAPLTRGSGQLGPAVNLYPADWLADRARGVPLTSQLITVDSLGRSHLRPWKPGLMYSYGAPFDARTLLTDDPGTGLQ